MRKNAFTHPICRYEDNLNQIIIIITGEYS